MLILLSKHYGSLKKLDFKYYREDAFVHFLNEIITFFDILSNYNQKRLFLEQSLFYLEWHLESQKI